MCSWGSEAKPDHVDAHRAFPGRKRPRRKTCTASSDPSWRRIEKEREKRRRRPRQRTTVSSLNVNQGTRTCDVWTRRVHHKGDGGALAMYERDVIGRDVSFHNRRGPCRKSSRWRQMTSSQTQLQVGSYTHDRCSSSRPTQTLRVPLESGMEGNTQEVEK